MMRFRTTTARLGLLGLLLLCCSPALADTPDTPDTAADPPTTEGKKPPIVDEEWRGLVFTPVKANRGFTFHKETFLLPLSWSEEYHGSQTEILAQMSFKVRILRSRFYAAFTMTSFWQAFDSANSAPFRETNYNPELFYRLTPSNTKLKRWGFDIGAEHNSNGQTIKRSRSWNRVYFAPHYRFKNSVLRSKVWYRIPEDDCVLGVEEVECDNNPDIGDFYGSFELNYDMQFGDKPKPPMLHLMAGGNIRERKGRVSVGFSYPARSRDVYYHFTAFYGYGESLIDHDQLRTRVAAGFRFIR